MKPAAVVMNMFYTGLGIARSLGENGVSVIGLTAESGVYGNFTRYAKIRHCPDSRNEPEALATYLLRMGDELPHGGVIFPTRDDDVVFLDRFREKLELRYTLAIPGRAALGACLDKWQTFQHAWHASIPSPNCWLIESDEDLERVLTEATYPAVLKAVAAHHWRRSGNWKLVGGRKAIAVRSPEELRMEYATIARADRRALLQELIPGADDCLIIVGCYVDRQGKWVAGFNTQKVVQEPDGFGTGCVVQAAYRPELFAPTFRLLQSLGFTGIAEVEYKYDRRSDTLKLIEINPRPWDQHRLGNSCGINLIHLAYCDYAGLPCPELILAPSVVKWVAEDAFILRALRLARRGNGLLLELFSQSHGKRIYAIWSARDPLPFLAYVTLRLIPHLVREAFKRLAHAFTARRERQVVSAKGGAA